MPERPRSSQFIALQMIVILISDPPHWHSVDRYALGSDFKKQNIIRKYV